MLNIEELQLPNMLSKSVAKEYRVRYLKTNLDDPSSLADLERVHTEALDGQKIVICYEERFTFMKEMFVVIKYLEKIDA